MINIGVIGGGLGLRCIIPKLCEIKDVNIMAFMTRSIEKAEVEGRKWNISYICKNIEEMCALPLDLICIASPTKHHYEQARYILSKKINILCEKPLGMNLVETEKMLKLFERSKQNIFIDLELRFNPYFIKMKEILKKSGEIYHIDMFFHSGLYKDTFVRNSWNYSPDEGGGIRMAIMPHFLDLLFFWINKECVSLRSYLNAVTNDNNVCDFCLALLEFEGGLTASLSASAVVDGNKDIVIRVLTTSGIIEFDLTNELQINKTKIEVNLPDYYDSTESIFKSSFGCYARNIIDVLMQKELKANFTSLEDMRKIHLLLNDIKVSANTGHQMTYKKIRNKIS